MQSVNLSQATVMSAQEHLERCGFIRKTRSNVVKRRVYASLSDEGLALLRESAMIGSWFFETRQE